MVSRLLLYGLTCAAVPVLRPRHRADGGFVLPMGHAIPLLGIAACGWLMLQVTMKSTLLTMGFLVPGSVLYAVARSRRGARTAADP